MISLAVLLLLCLLPSSFLSLKYQGYYGFGFGFPEIFPMDSSYLCYLLSNIKLHSVPPLIICKSPKRSMRCIMNYANFRTDSGMYINSFMGWERLMKHFGCSQIVRYTTKL